ncbi:hypothetical protein LOC68_24570 [Blastopirellula sp. JC732]|uniref:Uncharacterized protein n=1 Tax=Blastopirellula sediminis TaxID=2894196 RepID=A0A9X1MS10_9BACT|nr:hypothetical protein [Blastopirellula sediminis]MCC9605116.1 hypothetical protein [Blastopirellula sediminis]MCC9631584.1 hypothetical protein [Blastopirellula sediminis]
MNGKAWSSLLGVMIFASLGYAGGWGEMSGSAGADCGCATSPACGHGCGLNCANVWDGYCAPPACGTRIHSRYHWFARPSTCGCGSTCATGTCCDQYPMCDCNGPHFERVCEKCPSCLKMFRGYNSYSSQGCSTCGQSGTRMIQLGYPTGYEVEMMPASQVMPTKEAKLISPGYRATLPN